MFDRSPAAPFPLPPNEAKGKDPVHAAAFRAAVEGADAYRGVRAALRRDGPTVRLGNRFVPLAKYREVGFLALGNAAVSAAYGAHDALGLGLTQGLVVGPNPLPADVPFRPIVVGPGRPGHDGSGTALSEVLELASGLSARDLLVLLVTPGAVVSLAGPPAGMDASSWSQWLARLRDGGASARETAEVVRAVGTGGVAGGLARAAGAAEVVPLVVDRGDGGVLVGGGPTVPTSPAERAAARAVITRLGLLEQLPVGARAALAPDASRPLGLGSNVHRPVAVAGPADALRAAGEAITSRGYASRLSAMSHPGDVATATSTFLARVEEIAARDAEVRAPGTKGTVVFGPATFEIPEGDDERRIFPRFADAAGAGMRRRAMTVGVYQTSALPEPKGAAGIVVEAGSAHVATTPRPLGMRPGITDVGCLMVALLPGESRA